MSTDFDSFIFKKRKNRTLLLFFLLDFWIFVKDNRDENIFDTLIKIKDNIIRK